MPDPRPPSDPATGPIRLVARPAAGTGPRGRTGPAGGVGPVPPWSFRCPRCAQPRVGAVPCPRCGLPPPGSPPGPPAARRAGTITAVQVLLGLNAAANVVVLLIGLVGAYVASSLGPGVTGAPVDDETGATVGELTGGLYALAVWAALTIVFDLWAIRAVGAGRRAARVLVSLMPVADALVIVSTVPLLGTQSLANLVFVLPLGSALLILLWVPVASRRHFGDSGPAGPAGPTSRMPAPLLVALAVGVVLVVLAGVVVAASSGGGGSAVRTLAVGTWSCTAQGDEDTDVYGVPDNSPFDVVVGDGTFSIPSRDMDGTWTLENGTLRIESVWSKVRSRPRTSTELTGLPGALSDASSGTSPTTVHRSSGRTSGYNVSWSATSGHLTVSGGSGIAHTGVVCSKAG